MTPTGYVRKYAYDLGGVRVSPFYAHHTPVLHANIHVEQVLVCDDLVNLYVPQTLLDSLRSVGVLDA